MDGYGRQVHEYLPMATTIFDDRPTAATTHPRPRKNSSCWPIVTPLSRPQAKSKMQSTLSFTLIILAGTASQALASPHGALHPRQDYTPSVDLGYEVHTATENVRQ